MRILDATKNDTLDHFTNKNRDPINKRLDFIHEIGWLTVGPLPMKRIGELSKSVASRMS